MLPMVKIGKTRLDDLKLGDGLIQLVPRVFGNATAAVVAAPDAAGTEAASPYVARRIRCLWDAMRGAFSLSDPKTDVARFFQARNAAGQASQALGELDAAQGEEQGV